MKRYFLISLTFAFLFFMGGLGWGVWLHKKRAAQLAQSTPLRILCGENWLSQEGLEKFSRDHDVRIEQFTYTHPSDFLRQMANADGKVDVVCTSSLLVKSLVHSHWLKKMDFLTLSNIKNINADFLHLSYDPTSEYTVPLFWNLYGFFGKGVQPKSSTWKQTWSSKKVSLWGEELNVLYMMDRLDLNSSDRLVEDQTVESIAAAFKKFTKGTLQFLKPQLTSFSGDASMPQVDWIQIPLARVAKLLVENTDYHFWLPEDGASIEVGVLAVGDKSAQPELALALVNELISTPQALATHSQLDTGVVHNTLGPSVAIQGLHKPEALRQFPLNRLRFPDLDVEELPRFQKVFEETTSFGEE